MKFLRLLLFSLLFPMGAAYAQEPIKTVEDDTVIFEKVDTAPVYKSGMPDFYKYIFKEMKIDPNAPAGRTVIQFVVEKDGTISNAKAVAGDVRWLNIEAIRVISKSQKWKPGEVDGKVVRTLMNMPVTVKTGGN